MRRATRSALLGAGLVGLLAFPAVSRAASTPADLDARVAGLAQRVDEVHRNFSERSGLIGVGEATERYKDAVYQYLLGNYEPAAISFYILVQSNALGNADLARDSEWYLAESLFELGDYSTATEAYRLIVNKGESHPYFPDAVRRSLEVFALTDDETNFDAYYKAFLETNRVRSTDLVTYTLGKAFYRRGEDARATERFSAIAPGSPYYARSRYFLGTVHTRAGDYPTAITEFKAAEAAPAADADGRKVQEEASLALARVYFETREYESAAVYYAKIPKESPSYADALRESVWTEIYQEHWTEAAKAADTFLAAFPSHRYTADMQILRGHLGMKERDFDSAEAAYKQAVAGYTPIAETLEAAARDEETLHALLTQIADGKGSSPNDAIPAFAEEMLRGDDHVGRVTSLWNETRHQQDELAFAEKLLSELQLALGGTNEKLTNFIVARQELAEVWSSSLSTRGQLLESEAAYLRSRGSSTVKTSVGDILKDRMLVTATASAAPSAQEEAATRHKVARNYTDLHNRLKSLRGGMTDSTSVETFARLDREWAGLDKVDVDNDAASALLDGSESREMAAVRERLTTQSQRLSTLRLQVDGAATATAALSLKVMGQGVGALAAGFRDDVLQADKGIVDVYWLQKTETSDSMTQLAKDQTKALEQLGDAYASLRENLQ